MHGREISRFMPKLKVSTFANFEVGSLMMMKKKKIERLAV